MFHWNAGRFSHFRNLPSEFDRHVGMYSALVIRTTNRVSLEPIYSA